MFNQQWLEQLITACSVGWFVLLLVRKEVLLSGLCERKILFRLEIYDRLRQATIKRTGVSLDLHIICPKRIFYLNYY